MQTCVSIWPWQTFKSHKATSLEVRNQRAAEWNMASQLAPRRYPTVITIATEYYSKSCVLMKMIPKLRVFRAARCEAKACWASTDLKVVLRENSSIKISKSPTCGKAIRFVGTRFRCAAAPDANSVGMPTAISTIVSFTQQGTHLIGILTGVHIKKELNVYIYLWMKVNVQKSSRYLAVMFFAEWMKWKSYSLKYPPTRSRVSFIISYRSHKFPALWRISSVKQWNKWWWSAGDTTFLAAAVVKSSNNIQRVQTQMAPPHITCVCILKS